MVGGGFYNAHLSTSVLRTSHLFNLIFSSFLSDNFKNLDFLSVYKSLKLLPISQFNALNGIKNIYFYKNKYFLFHSKQMDFIDSFSSNLNIINARKFRKIY